MKKFILPTIIIAVVVVLAVVYFSAKPEQSMEAPQNGGPTTTVVPTGSTAKTPGQPAPQPSGGTVQVDVKGFAFVSQTVRIAPGTTIRWKNFDTAKHTVTSDTGLFNSDVLAKDGTFSYKFTKEGTYNYHCALHPEMTGEIVVRAF